jgi:bifunctional enzyme CysN/CysC
MIVPTGNVPRVDTKFDAMVVWMDEQPMVPGSPYVIKHTTKKVAASVSTLRYKIDVNTMHRCEAPTLALNEIGRCAIKLNQQMMFDGYRRNRGTGSFIMIDRLTNRTVAAGMILDSTSGDELQDHWDDQPQSERLHSERGKVTHDQRGARFGQRPATILLTGLSGAGKTSIAYALERALFDQGRAVSVLDGQNMRLGISRDLGFTADDRSENLRRCIEIAKLINDAGLITICAFVAPREAVRQKARDAIGADRFLLVHLSAPVEVCRERDKEGLYGAADSGEIADFPGVSFAFEPPSNPDLVLPTHERPVDECVEEILRLLHQREFLS